MQTARFILVLIAIFGWATASCCSFRNSAIKNPPPQGWQGKDGGWKTWHPKPQNAMVRLAWATPDHGKK